MPSVARSPEFDKLKSAIRLFIVRKIRLLFLLGSASAAFQEDNGFGLKKEVGNNRCVIDGQVIKSYPRN